MSWRFTGKTFIPLPPEFVYPLISTATGFKKWFVRKCQLDAHPGGRFNMHFARNDMVLARVTRMAPGESFCFEWPIEDVHTPTEVQIHLEVLGKGTLLTLSDGDFEADIKEAKRFHDTVQGWTGYLWNLKSVAMHGLDLRSEWE